ncbi:MAG TPA: FliM/FliN family flagellar motor switch protein [Dyella sp.]|uniref:FliM/FliN family flagellar motor switch protein n=1 Tax=Dyella sp. TaxID=1869338 RepID=UPI002C71B1B5|nr:FliM/FliN family flagellar motor switch protein [Dyella sp.]HUB90328.1 FliM/FliN family flagellar motor switch protein [Dyella sp.]
MTQDVHFGWLGESRRTALLALLAGLVDDWARDWWVGAAEGVVEVHADEQDGSQDKRNLPWMATTDNGVLAVYAGGKDVDSIGRLLANASTTTDADAELAQRVGEDAMADLAVRIQRRAGIGKAAQLARDNAPLSVEHARLGAFRAIATIGRLQLTLAIDRGMADRLAPPAAIAREPGLLSRQAAIHTAPLRVQAVMDFGSVDLAHLSDLSVGEVLVGDRKLDEPLQIHVQGHGAVATGYLRRSGEQRAVVLDGIHRESP